MGNVDQVRARVQSILTQNFNNVTVDRDGDFSLRNGSARAFVSLPENSGDGPTMVRILIPLLRGVRDTPELHEHIAFHADDFTFGHLSLWRQKDGQVDIFMTHNLLGDYLDDDELGYAVALSLGTADDLDDSLQTQFGGERFHDE